MGQQLSCYKGAVVFIDLLGFGALTNNKINLAIRDIKPWITEHGHPITNQFLAANLLVKFRSILQNLEQEFPNITIAQLSDSFFAWSDSSIQILKFTHKFMWIAIESGLLCRGGMAYGEIINTGNNHLHGRLILGAAVTKAVNLESLSKGARILTEPDIAQALNQEDELFARKTIDFIKALKNPLDYQEYDEFKWYLCKDLDIVSARGVNNNKDTEKIQMTKDRLRLSNHILYSPKFSWNSKNLLGMVHLEATNKFLSEDGLLNIKHHFDTRHFVSGPRTLKKFNTSNEVIENDSYN